MTVFEDSALAYAQDQGFYVFPLKPRDKIPLTPHGLEDATVDTMTIQTWWSRWPDANVAIRTGTIVVVDEDQPGAFAELAAAHGATVPETRVARTGTGRHYYFTQPDDFRVRNTAGKLAKGIDTRGDGGYVVAPPSIHPNGTPYVWESETAPAPLPPWLAELMRPKPLEYRPLNPIIAIGATTSYGERALENEAQAVANAPEGTRNSRLNIAAFSLGQLVAGGEVDEWDARNALEAAARACGLEQKEIELTIRSGLAGGMALPRKAPERPATAAPKLTVVPTPAQSAVDSSPEPAPAEPLLRIVSLDQFVSVTEDTADPIIGEPGDSLLPADGLLLMYGDGGAGKTTLSIDALAHLASGTNWLDTTVPQPVRTLLIENEGPRGPFRETLARKLDKWAGGAFSSLVHVLEEPWSRFTLGEETYRHAIAQEIAQLEIELVIVGPLASLGAKGTGTPDEVSEFAAMITDLRTRAQRPFGLWIVHHENKAGDVSGAWERLPDTLVHVSAQGNGRTRVHWRKVRWSSRLHNTSVQLLWDDGGFKLEEARQRDYPAEVIDAFSRTQKTWLTARETAALLDPSAGADTIRPVLEELQKQGRLVFEIGPKGRNVTARCWRLRGDQEPPSHPKSPGLFEGGGSEGDLVTPPTKESPQSLHPTQSSPGDLTPPGHPDVHLPDHTGDPWYQ